MHYRNVLTDWETRWTERTTPISMNSLLPDQVSNSFQKQQIINIWTIAIKMRCNNTRSA